MKVDLSQVDVGDVATTRPPKTLQLDEYGAEYCWTTKVGDSIPLSKLDGRHLRNIINYMHDTMLYPAVGIRGEMAEYYADQAFDAAMDSHIGWMHILNNERSYREQQQ